MPMSSVPAFKAALFARLQTMTWPSPAPLVSWGDVSPSEPDWRMVTIAGAQMTQVTATIGRFAREESYTVAVDITAIGDTQTFQYELETVAYSLADVIEASLKAWATEGPAPFGGIVRWCRITGSSDEVLESNQGRGSLVTLEITCDARIN